MTENSRRIDHDADTRTAELSSLWVTVGLVVLAAPNLAAGIWGLIAPQHWFDNFPGWAPRLVAAFAPFNDHLVSDAAAGLFASGVAATVALLWRRQQVVITAMVALLAFAVPHAAFHLTHPADALSSTENALNTVTLWLAVAIAVAITLVATRRDSQPRTHVPGDEHDAGEPRPT